MLQGQVTSTGKRDRVESILTKDLAMVGVSILTPSLIYPRAEVLVFIVRDA
jgi:hypothetical protein